MRHCAAVLVIAGTLLASSVPAFAQFVQQGPKLVGTGGVGASMQGSAVAVSADGNTAIVGGWIDDTSAGAAWVFTRSNGAWTQQGIKLVGTGAVMCCVGRGHQGTSVAISADGNTAIVGGVSDDNGVGASWIFVRSGGVWAQQGAKLVGTGVAGTGAHQGTAVALSADGNTALVGGDFDGDQVVGNILGAAWVFVRSGSTWTQQGPKLDVTDATATRLGSAVALSADGSTALIGAASGGTAWVFVRSTGSWTPQGSMTPADPDGFPGFGQSVALSSDGNTAAIGGPYDGAGPAGAAWVFTRGGSAWTQQGSKLVAAGAGTRKNQGWSVSLSGDGHVLVTGAPGDAANRSAAWSFVRSGATWTQTAGTLTGTGAGGNTGPNGPHVGVSVAVSSDGVTALVGDFHDNAQAGATWVFRRPAYGGDVDGDRRADATVYRPNGEWATATSSSGYTSPSIASFPAPFGSVPVRSDFDGDGLQDPAFYNPSSGNWKIRTSGSGYTTTIDVTWGGPGYAAVPGDYDGDLKADIAVCSVRTGAWNILQSRTNFTSAMNLTLGTPGITPIGGEDFDGDAIADPAVFQPATGLWSVLYSTSAFTTGVGATWGGRGYTLVPGDYDGDRRADLGLYQRTTGAWFILTSGSGFMSAINFSWGGTGFLPVPADYDGDGILDPGIYQLPTGNWSALQSSSHFTTTLQINGWGADGDIPISTAIPVGANDVLRAGDFDGDMRAEITVFNPANGVWSSLTSSTSFAGAANRSWGGTGYPLAPGDYDGDGRPDLGIFQPTPSPFFKYFYVLLSSTRFTTTFSPPIYDGYDHGVPRNETWVPVSADYDGDGRTDPAIFNPARQQWSQRLSGEAYAYARYFTYGTGEAVPADYDGDGSTDVATYDGAIGRWSVRLSSTNNATSQTIDVGGPGWSPVPADYDGDGRADFVVYNTSTGQWYGLLSSATYTTTFNIFWGGTGYAPVRGDYDGDGKSDLAVYVESTSMWYILLSGADYTTTIGRSWGGPDYVAVR